MVCTVIFMSNPTVVLCCVGVGVLTIMGLETALPGENTLQQSVGLADKGEY